MENRQKRSPADFVRRISDLLGERSFPEPRRLEAEYLVSRALNISRTDIYLESDRICSDAEEEAVKELLEQRLGHKPLSYIIGDCDFWTLNLKVGRGTLIPRKETEILVENALKLIPVSAETSYNILELGTGSAAIPLALASERENLNIFAVEKSAAALRFALQNTACLRRENMERNNEIRLIRGDAFKAIKRKPLFDLIVSNPPYISDGEIDTLQEEVKDWEPLEALSGGEDGLDFFRILKKDSEAMLKPGAFLIFEHGFDQKSSLKKLMSDSSALRFYDAVKDCSNLDRILVYQKANNQAGK